MSASLSPGYSTKKYSDFEVSELVHEVDEPLTWWNARIHKRAKFYYVSKYLREEIFGEDDDKQEKSHFDILILMVIVVNCVFMIVETEINWLVEVTCLCIFWTEMLLKMTAFGICGYFRSGWNSSDCLLVVSTSFASFFEVLDMYNGGWSNVSAIRVLRVLRPLRAISFQLRIIIKTIFNSVSDLVDVGVLLFFFFTIFGITGTQLFNGVLHRRCFSNLVPADVTYQDWSKHQSQMDPDLSRFCRKLTKKDCSGDSCNSKSCPDPDYPRCFEIAPNPFSGVVSWDNIFSSMLQIFWIVTLESWVTQMYYLQEAFNPTAGFLFVGGLVVFLLSFFAMNLFLAVIENSYTELMKEEKTEDYSNNWDGRKRELYQQVCYQKTVIHANMPLVTPRSCTIDMESLLEAYGSHTPNSPASPARHIAKAVRSRQNPSGPSQIQDTNFFRKSHYPSYLTPQSNIEVLSPSTPVEHDKAESTKPAVHEKRLPPVFSPPTLEEDDTIRTPQKADIQSWEHSHSTLNSSDNSTNGRMTDTSTDTPGPPNASPDVGLATLRKLNTWRTTRRRLNYNQMSELWMKTSMQEVKKKGVLAQQTKDDHQLTRRCSLKDQSQTGSSIWDDFYLNFDSKDLVEAIREQKKKNFDIAHRAWMESRDSRIELNGMPFFSIYAYELAESSWLQRFFDFCIILNTIVLMIYWPDMPVKLNETFQHFNQMFAVIFLVEMVIKHLGYGFKVYWLNLWDRFDGFVTILSTSEAMLLFLGITYGNSFIIAFRTARVLRLLRMIRSSSFQTILSAFMESLQTIISLVSIMLIFIFTFAIIGQSFFEADWSKVQTSAYSSFGKGFWWSFITVLQIVTGDSWNMVMIDVASVYGHWSCFYFIFAVFFGNFVMLNIFIAVLLSSLRNQTAEKFIYRETLAMAKQYRKKELLETKPKQIKRLLSYVQQKNASQVEMKVEASMRGCRHSLANKLLGKSLLFFSPKSKLRQQCQKIIQNKWFLRVIDALIVINCVFVAVDGPKMRDRMQSCMFGTEIFFIIVFSLEIMMKILVQGAFGRTRESLRWSRDDELAEELNTICEDTVQKISEKDNDRPYFRDQPMSISKVMKSIDGWIIVELTKTETMRLVYRQTDDEEPETPNCHGAFVLDRRAGWHKAELLKNPEIKKLDDEFGIIMQICKSPSCKHENYNAFFKSSWNQLDFFVLVIWILGFIFPDSRLLVACRALRPLRIAVRTEKIRVVMESLVLSFTAVLSSALFCAVLWLIFAIVGMSLFSNKMHDCVCTASEGCDLLLEGITNRSECEATVGLEWTNSVMNFDNIFNSIHTLFYLSTLVGWSEIMYICVNSTGVDTMPEPYHNSAAAVYFVLVVFICSFFSLNLLVTVVLDNFHRISTERNGSAFLTDRQWQLVTCEKISRRITLGKRKVPELSENSSNLRHAIYNIVQQPSFDSFILFCIVLNVICMASEHYRMHDAHGLVINIMEVIFVVIFTLEAFCKIYAWGFRFYISEHWNQFDFAIVLSSYVVLLPLRKLGLSINILRLFRFARVLRFVRIVKHYARLRVLMETLYTSIPALWNIGLLLFILIFIFTVFGMSLFGPYDCDVNPNDPCEGDAKYANFSNFFIGAMLLYRVATSDGWTVIYRRYLALMDHDTWLVQLYFISFFFLGTLVLLNLFIGFVLEAFGDNQKLSKIDGELEPIREWRDKFEKYDKSANGKITAKEFVDTLIESPEPLGLQRETGNQSLTHGQVYNFLKELCLPVKREKPSHLGTFSTRLTRNSSGNSDTMMEGGGGRWMVRFDKAAFALATKLLHKGELKIKLGQMLDDDIHNEPTKQSISEWFCQEYRLYDEEAKEFELTYEPSPQITHVMLEALGSTPDPKLSEDSTEIDDPMESPSRESNV